MARRKRGKYSGQKEGKSGSAGRLGGYILIGAVLSSLLTLLLLGYMNPEFSYFGRPITGNAISGDLTADNNSTEELIEKTDDLKKTVDELRDAIKSLTDVLKIRDSKGQEIGAQITENKDKGEVEVIANSGPVKKIVFYNLKNPSSSIDLGIDEVGVKDGFSKVYAIDPTRLEFDNATVTVTATGTELYKCKDWNFTEQSCFGSWVPFKTGLIPGQEYTFTLTAADPGFGEFNGTVAESSTLSTTFVNKTVLTFNVPTSGTYTILASAEMRGDSGSIDFEGQLTLDGVSINNLFWRPIVATGYESLGAHTTLNLSAGSHTAIVQWRTTSGSVNSVIRNANIVALRLEDARVNSTENSRALSVGSFAEVQRLTFTPSTAGEYIIIANAELNGSSNNDIVRGRVFVDGVSISNFTYALKNTGNVKDMFTHRTMNLSASQHNITMGAQAIAGDTGEIRRTRISAIRMTDQFVFATNESNAETSTVSDVLIDKVNLSFTPQFSGEYVVLATADIRQDTAAPQNRGVRAVLDIDGATYGNVSFHPLDGSEYSKMSTVNDVTLNTSPHMLRIRFSRIDGGTAYIKNARITIFRIERQGNISVFDVRPLNGASFNVSDVVEISANVTTSLGVNTVFANVTMPNGTVQRVTLTNAINSKYNGSFTIPAALQGTYNVSFFANNTLGSINDTERTSFVVGDTVIPHIFDLRPVNGTNFNVSTTIEVAANVTDPGIVSAVLANVTFPNGTSQLLTLSNVVGAKYNASFTIPITPKERYNITFIANDTNNNVNSTERTYFNALDNVDPSVFDLRPLNGTLFNVSDTIEVSANVTDNVAVDTVLANITLPNGTVQILTLTNAVGNKYNASFSPIVLGGDYSVIFIANDSSNNFNSTSQTNFSITGQSAAIFSTDLTSYKQGTVMTVRPEFALRQNITFEAKYYNSLIGPSEIINNGNCSVILSNTGKSVNLVFNSTTGNYTGQIDTYTEWGNNTATLNCTSPTFSAASNSRYVPVYWINYLIGTGNIFFGGPNNNQSNDTVWISKREPTSTTPLELNKTVSLSPGAGNVSVMSGFFCGSNLAQNCSFQRSYLFEGMSKVRLNVSASADNTCLLKGCLHVSTSDLSNIFELCSDPVNVTTVPTVVEQNITIPSFNMHQGGFLSFFARCDAGPAVLSQTNVTLTAYYNYSGEPINFEILNVRPFDLLVTEGEHIANGTSFNLGPNERLNLTISETVFFNNTATTAASFQYHHLFEILDQFQPSAVFNRSFVYNSTGDLWASDNASLGTVELATFNAPDILTYTTESIPGNSVRNNTIALDYRDALRDNETLLLNLSYEKKWSVEVRTIFSEEVTVHNVTAFTNYSTYIPSGSEDFTFNVTLLNDSGIFDVTSTSTINRTTKTITFPAQHLSTIYFNVTANDTRSPQVFAFVPANGTHFNVSDVVEIAANVTDGSGVIAVFANVTFPNSTVQTLALSSVGGNKYNSSFTIPSHLHGRYNITFIANDTNSNTNSTEKTYFIAGDTVNPQVFDLRPTAGSVYALLAVIEIAANVTDNDFVGPVSVRIVYPDGAVNMFNLSTVVGSKYSVNFTIPNIEGRYNVTIFANDTNGNMNNTEKTHFFGGDFIPPAVTGLIPINGTVYNIGTNIEIAANITDSISAIGTVYANITSPNGTVQLVQLTLAADNKYNGSFVAPNTPQGRFNVTIIANDSRGNVNGTETTYFIGEDTINPQVVPTSPYAEQEFNASDVIQIAANVTDNGILSLVWVEILYPDNAVNTLTLTSVGSNKFNTTFAIPGIPGIYNITYFANDTNGNLNGTESFVINVEDFRPPRVVVLSPQNGTTFDVSTTIEIAANMTDNFNVIDSASANVTFPNGTVQVLTLNSVGNNKFNASFTIPNTPQGQYNVTFIAADPTGNTNSTTRTNFIAGDTSRPSVVLVYPPVGLEVVASQVVELAVNVTDNGVISAVRANVTLPNGTVEVFALSQVGTTAKYNTSYTVASLSGQYDIRFIANDTDGNVNSTTTTFLLEGDVTPPLVFDLRPINGTTFNVSDVVEIAANVTDGGGQFI